MKKVLFGLVFIGAMAFSGTTAQCQGSVDPGEDDKWVCCKEADVFCTDIHGNARANSIKKAGRFCP
ncbi:MAG: hypothetical protein ACQEW9_14335 [Bacteroidota bacterium]